MPKTSIQLKDGFFTTVKSRHHVFHADEPKEDGGSDQAPRPSEMLLGALGSCVAITLKLYAQRKNWPLEGIDIQLDYARLRGEDYPAYEGDEPYIHEYREKIILHGPLNDEQKSRLMDIATKCPVRKAISTPSFFVDLKDE
jgi:putative redox protein